MTNKQNEIKAWLEGDQNYFKGIELYNTHAYGPRRIFPIQPTCPQCLNQLKNELESILQQANQEAAAKATEGAAAKAAEEAAAKATEGAAAKAAEEAAAKAAEEAAAKKAEDGADLNQGMNEAITDVTEDPASDLSTDHQEQGAACQLEEELRITDIEALSWNDLRSLYSRLRAEAWKIEAASNKRDDIEAALKEAQKNL